MHKAVFLKGCVKCSEKLTLFIKFFSPVATFRVQGGEVQAIFETVKSILPRRSVVNIADQVLVQVSWIKTQAYRSIFLNDSYYIVYPLSRFWTGSDDSFLLHLVQFLLKFWHNALWCRTRGQLNWFCIRGDLEAK